MSDQIVEHLHLTIPQRVNQFLRLTLIPGHCSADIDLMVTRDHLELIVCKDVLPVVLEAVACSSIMLVSCVGK
ncbi:MAG: hypothetical protein GX338_10005 [Firmicutes bacterium]|nr:hypothetical protein [Bacillota bacterium]